MTETHDMTRLKKLLEKFKLDDFGRNGLHLEAEEEITVQTKSELFTGHYTHKVHQLQET
jgi:hypothetical protein